MPGVDCRELIAGIHLWGKKRSAKGNVVAHAGDLNTYFEDSGMKRVFLGELFRLLDDGRAWYFVPEVNCGDEDLGRIVGEMLATGFILL